MELFLLRHGIAAEPDGARYSEEDRPLTDEGIEKMRLASRGIRRVVETFDLILTSPLLRTVQTAAIVAEAFKPAIETRVCAELALGGSAKKISALLEESGAARVLLVGHEPELCEVFSLLTGSRANAVEIKKGALLWFTVESFGTRPRAYLRWHLTSKQLRAMGNN